MTYSTKLQNPKWQRKRLEVLNRDGFACKLCSDTETQLDVHHLKYTGKPWDALLDDLITLCRHCHEAVESDAFKAIGAPILSAKKPFFLDNGDIEVILFYESQVSIYLYHADTGRCGHISTIDRETIVSIYKLFELSKKLLPQQ